MFLEKEQAVAHDDVSIARNGSDCEQHGEPCTHFGFRNVREAEKASLVKGVFRSVATRYDLMNDILSFRLHRLWKDAIIDVLGPRPGRTYLDVAGGTGDIAFRVGDYLERRAACSFPFSGPFSGPGTVSRASKEEGECRSRIIICDLTETMLLEGRARSQKRKDADLYSWLAGDAMCLALPDDSVDVYTISFGLRNVVHPEAALEEAMRVLKPGGRFVCLEFSRVALPFLDRLYDFYSFNMLPKLGKWITGSEAAYQYLVESIRKFPDQELLLSLMQEAGMGHTTYRNMSGGIVALHSGWKF